MVFYNIKEYVTSFAYAESACYNFNISISGKKLKLLFSSLVGCVILIFAMTNTANASIINYDEAVGGDLNGSLNFGVLTEGVHQIAGQLSFAEISSNSDSIDSFSFEIPDGFQITSGVLELLNFVFDAPAPSYSLQLFTSFQDQPGSNPFLILSPTFTETSIPTTFPAAFTIDNNLLPVGPGSYNGLIGFSGSPPPNMLLNYRLSYSVSTVPLPAAFWLFGTAMTFLMGFMRIKKGQ